MESNLNEEELNKKISETKSSKEKEIKTEIFEEEPWASPRARLQ